MTYSQARGIFGFNGESSIGQVGFPAVQVWAPALMQRDVALRLMQRPPARARLQAAPSFPDSFPHMFGPGKKLRCLIPCAIDQVRSQSGGLRCSVQH